MRKLLLLSIGIILCASIAYGQAGYIGLFSDPTYTTCDYTDLAMALVPVYVVHKATPGASAVQFMMQSGNGFNCTYTGESSPMPTVIGNAFAGISIGYGGCRSSDLLILTVNFFCTGISPDCASLEVMPDVAAPTGTIEVVDCFFVKLEGNGSVFYMNPDGTCDCGEIVPTQDTSWGKIKSMYGN